MKSNTGVCLWSSMLALALSGLTVPAFAALELSTDHRSLFFGLMELGEEKLLADAGSFHNEITCSSTEGRPWYLKVSVLQPLTSGSETIPLEQFAWQLAGTNGKGTVTNRNEFRAFALVPDLVYLSSPEEATGQSVQLQFRYSLKIPEAQVSGVYHTTVRFTLTEIL